MTYRWLAILSLSLPSPLLAQAPQVRWQDGAKEIRLEGAGAVHTLLVEQTAPAGHFVDATHQAKFKALNPQVAAVTPQGLVRAVGDGTTTVQAEVAGQALSINVVVSGMTRARMYHFENDIVPLLSRFGCNSSGCHGSAEGQNGFKLSVFGSDPAFDHNALTKEVRGRRLLPAAPEHSLLLAKAAGTIAHGGGTRIPRGSFEYETIKGWIAAGAPLGDPAAPHVASLRLEPQERVFGPRGQQRLRVLARTSDGRELDVTPHARFQSNNDGLASVSAEGVITAGEVPGEAAIMASYMNQVAVFRALMPRPTDKVNLAEQFKNIPEFNFIDQAVHQKLKKLNILPSDVCDDATYLRRVHLDISGTLPTPAEARRFLDSKDKDKRAKLVDELLERPEYADLWALWWADLLRVDRQALGSKRAYVFYRWIRDQLARNTPYDRFVRDIVTAQGPLDQVGPANFFKVAGKPGEQASSLAQVFLGIRIACAECHHHPFDQWSQTDYFGMQAFFTPVALGKAGPTDYLTARGNPVTKHPRTGETVHAHVLGAKMPEKSPEGDRRQVLAAWLTAPDNPWLARNLANRLWAHFLGRGLVEPVDDVRATNPPTNPELLTALAKHLVDKKFDIKDLIRAITASRTYQLATTANASNEKDELNHSRGLLRRLQAEVLLDMVSQTTGVAEEFTGVPEGTRAVQLWDSRVNHYFLKTFGRPVRATACECERISQPSVAQVLHLLNAQDMQNKLSHEGGTVAKLARQRTDDAALVDELYLTFYSRLPLPAERATALEHVRRDPTRRRQAAEDLAWTLMNSLEFVFNH